MRNAVYSIAIAVLIPCAGRAQILYNINFQTPGQGVNQTVQTGPAPQYVSSVVFGNPVVVSAYGGLNDQPLLFASNGGNPPPGQFDYTQIQLNFGIPNPPTLDLAFDFVDTGAAHTFTILFDTPEVQNFQFNQGVIAFLDPTKFPDNFGTYTQGQDYHFDIHVNFQQSNWTFYEVNSAIGTGTFTTSSNVFRSIRFNYSETGPATSATAIDNVIVTVPEPSQATLALGFAAFCTLWRRRI